MYQYSFLILTQYVILSLMVMVAVAFFSLMERKVLSLIHYRVGPNKVFLSGFLQPFADAMKLLTKDDYPVSWSNHILYYISPLLMFSISLSAFIIYPFFSGDSQSLSVIVLMIFLGMAVYANLVSGWSSNSKYALIGSMRSVAQSLSYEVVFSFMMLMIISVMASYSIWEFAGMPVTLLGLMSPLTLCVFLVVALAELNRTPFDLSEGESELVSGYSVEFGGVMYTFLFLGENVSIFVSCFMMSYFFLCKSSLLLPLVWSLCSLLVCLIRGALPRLRYDILMQLCWLTLLPGILVLFNSIMFKIAFIN